MKKTVLISGGSDGIGFQIAKILSPNYSVIICSRNEDKLKKAAEELGCDYEVCDVSDNSSIENAVRNITSKHKKIDCLINNAGVWIEGKLEDNQVADIENVLAVNTLGTILLTRAVVPHMKEQKDGTIVNIISGAGLNAKKERSVYTASKFAVTGFTRSIQPELSKHGIKTIGIFPGKINTKLFDKVGIEKDMSNALDAKEVAKTVEFTLSLDKSTVITEMNVRHIDG